MGAGLGTVEPGVQGMSLAPLLDDTAVLQGDALPPAFAAKVALSQFARCGCNTTNATAKPIDGITTNSTNDTGTSTSTDTDASSTRAHRGTPDDMVCGHCVTTPSSEFEYMGYSLRSPRGWRYTEWVAWDGAAIAPNWTDVRGVELYDHRNDTGSELGDFNAWENANVAHHAAYAQEVARVSNSNKF